MSHFNCRAFFVISMVASSSGICEKFENVISIVGFTKTCFMESTVIDSTCFLIATHRDETVEGFDAFGNRNLEYLPNNLGEKFSNLLFLQAGDCSIKEIFKENFSGLKRLQILNLQYNQIESIDDDTFEYIPVVEEISLS